MGMFINTNVAALNAQRNLGITGLKMGKALERLSSGLRINRAADDAARALHQRGLALAGPRSAAGVAERTGRDLDGGRWVRVR